MARALRIELAGGWYHVANRGAGRQRIFRNDHQRGLFLELLGELGDRYGVAVHAYCLMTHRYDLLLRTALPNLSAAMRHLDGIYTQRFNRMMTRDGPLFRGRYRSILLEPETCLLPVSRHLHRRPLAAGTVPRLDRYRWSSYPSYVTRRKRPGWLEKGGILARVAELGEHRGYRQYVERESLPGDRAGEQVADFYRARRPGAILGPPGFRAWALHTAGPMPAEVPAHQRRPPGPTPDAILAAVAAHYAVSPDMLRASRRGRLNLPRLAAMWLCRHRAHLTLRELAEHFGLASYGSASAALHRVRADMRPAFWRHVRTIEAALGTAPGAAAPDEQEP